MEKLPKIQKTECGLKVEIMIPFVEGHKAVLREYPRTKILSDNQKALINALTERAIHCYNDMVANVTTICFNDGQVIVYKDSNGQQKQFNYPSFQAMTEAIDWLYSQMFESFKKYHYDQMLKAVVFYEDKQIFTDYEKLVRYLIEHIVLG